MGRRWLLDGRSEQPSPSERHRTFCLQRETSGGFFSPETRQLLQRSCSLPSRMGLTSRERDVMGASHRQHLVMRATLNVQNVIPMRCATFIWL